MPSAPDSYPARTSVLAIHGNGGGSVRFERVPEALGEHAVLHPAELPGFDGRPLPRGSSVGMATFLEPLLEQLRSLPRPRVVLGHGVGGSLALELAQWHGRDLEGLILHAPVGADLDTRRFPKLMRPRLMRALVRRALASPLLRPMWRRRLFGDADVPSATVDRFFRGYRDCAAFGAFFDLLTARWFQSLVPIDLPARLLWGGRERVLAPSHAAAFQRVLPRAELHVEPDWDHFPMIVQPDEYARVVGDLVADLVRSRDGTSGMVALRDGLSA